LSFYLAVGRINLDNISSECGREKTMLLKYIEAAMSHAEYEILEDDGEFYGEIRICNGVWAQAKTLEECRKELQEVLEEWILFRVNRNLLLPSSASLKSS
jgi:predicted RNase H-like HicB family nuclease